MSSPAADRAAGITHLIPSSTFLPFVAGVFEEAAPGRNRVLVYGARIPDGVPAGVPVELVGTEPAEIERVAEEMSRSRVAVVHSMSTFSAQVLAAVPATTLRVWSGFGGEYYGSPLDPMAGLLGRSTARLMRRSSPLRERAVRAYNNRYVDTLLRGAARATDVFSAPAPTDLAVFRRRFPGFRGRYHQLNYASVDDTYAVPPDRVTGGDVLVGNSATPENNHLETFELLAGVDLGARRIVVPLSYGDPVYADEVARAGVEMFGARFAPIRELLPLAEYSARVAGCGIVVMGHRRQQALGNVGRALWQGAHVFMDLRSPLRTYLADEGFDVPPLEHLIAHGVPPRSVTPERLDANRRIARSLWGRDVVVANARGLVQGV